MKIVMIGAPGSGKGTQANRLTARLGVPVISTGEILRSEVNSGSELGRAAERTMNVGGYVADHIVDAIVCDRLIRNECSQGFILDGYPRTVDQIASLDATLARATSKLDAAVHLVVDRDEIRRRLLKRGKEQGRSDDTAETIERRLDTYFRSALPLVQEYAVRGVLVEADGSGEPEAVHARLVLALLRLERAG